MNYGTGKVYTYSRNKVNKQSSIYQMDAPLESDFLTPLIRLEKFQGYSKAYNLTDYLRTNRGTFKEGEQVTGLWPTQVTDIYFGDWKNSGVKTLLLFKFSPSREMLQIKVFPSGFYPSKQVIEKLAKEF